MEWSSVFAGLLTTLLAAAVLASLRALWARRQHSQGTVVASKEPPTSRGWDATVALRWRGAGAAWHVLAIPLNASTAMAHGTIEAHVLRDGDGELRFQIRNPARIAILWRPGLKSRTARGHVLDTGAGVTRPMTRRELRDVLES